MAPPRNLPHIVVPFDPNVDPYTPHPRNMDIPKAPAPPSRAAHGQALKRAFMAASVEARKRRSDAAVAISGARPGLYVQFEGQPGVPLKLSSLEDARQGIELVAVVCEQTAEPKSRIVEKATVFVPEGKVKHFLSRFDRYASDEPKTKGERRHEEMLDPVATLRLATLRALWTDAPGDYPSDDQVIW